MNALINGTVPDVFNGVEEASTFNHKLHEADLFSDESLARILSTYPKEELYIATMEPQRDSDWFWRTGTITGLTGDQALEAVKRGHLWFNLKKAHKFIPELGNIIDDLFADISEKTGSRLPFWHSGSLLISSPSAFVPFHADCEPNLLFHIRGRKRIWIYPAMDPRFAALEDMETICAGKVDEDLPYLADFDEEATVYDLTPGLAASFPQNAPHRIENIDGLNVSLSTEFLTPAARRRIYVMRANHQLRQATGWGPMTFSVEGPAAEVKVAFARMSRLIEKLAGRPAFKVKIEDSFRVDPSAPKGFVKLA